MSALRIPIVKTDAVFHLGSMSLEHRGAMYSESLEGHCLSVSHCPNAWRRIAMLGGQALWKLTNPGAAFLDIHAVEKNKKLRATIEDWGIRMDYCEPREAWRTWIYDSESESWGFLTLDTKEAAEREIQDEDDEGPNGGPVVEPFMILAGRQPLCDRMGLKNLPKADIFDFVAMLWAEDTQPEITGVWWREEYAPENLSAPRGGIFPSRLSQWAHQECGSVTDDDCEEGLVVGKMFGVWVHKPAAQKRKFARA